MAADGHLGMTVLSRVTLASVGLSCFISLSAISESLDKLFTVNKQCSLVPAKWRPCSEAAGKVTTGLVASNGNLPPAL